MSTHTAATPTGRDYLPGMGRDWLLPLYDPLTRLLRVPAAHRTLIDRVDLRPGERVLEVGCGTGNLALAVKRLRPDVTVAGLDPDPKALARAARKGRAAGLAVAWQRGFAEHLPYEEGAFDHVLSSLMFHHLDPDGRRQMLAEVRRVLRPAGSLNLIDFGDGGEHAHGPIARLSRRNPRLQDNFGDRIPTLMTEAGLSEATETGHATTRAGRLTTYRATRR
jgi:ubiquinone/menaquinone biosynthesis C-methylase UbiE